MHQEWHFQGEKHAAIMHRDDCSLTDWQININSWGRDPYARRLAEGLQSKPFPDAVEDATKVFEDVCERFFNLFGSTGKA